MSTKKTAKSINKWTNMGYKCEINIKKNKTKSSNEDGTDLHGLHREQNGKAAAEGMRHNLKADERG
jgi:hypothetical protein